MRVSFHPETEEELEEAHKYALVGVALGVIPVLLIMTMFGGTFRSLLSPEAMLFGCMFTAFGAAFGTGFWIAYGRHAA